MGSMVNGRPPPLRLFTVLKQHLKDHRCCNVSEPADGSEVMSCIFWLHSCLKVVSVS
jgi:hypothetical protein